MEGGRVVAADAVGLAELEHRLWAITRDRRRSIDPDRSTTCQRCGAARVGNFRWCKSCGSDFESERPPTDQVKPAVPAMAEPVTSARRATAPEERVAQSSIAIAQSGPARGRPADPARSREAPPVWLLTAPDDDLDLVKPFPAARPVGVAPPQARPIPPPVASSRLSRWMDDVFSDEWLAPSRLWLGAFIGLAIGVTVTIVLLAIE